MKKMIHNIFVFFDCFNINTAIINCIKINIVNIMFNFPP